VEVKPKASDDASSPTDEKNGAPSVAGSGSTAAGASADRFGISSSSTRPRRPRGRGKAKSVARMVAGSGPITGGLATGDGEMQATEAEAVPDGGMHDAIEPPPEPAEPVIDPQLMELG